MADALANSIRSIDKGHIITLHPRGRTTSATWFNDREWLDFNMFQKQSLVRYGQRNGDGDYPVKRIRKKITGVLWKPVRQRLVETGD